MEDKAYKVLAQHWVSPIKRAKELIDRGVVYLSGKKGKNCKSIS